MKRAETRGVDPRLAAPSSTQPAGFRNRGVAEEEAVEEQLSNEQSIEAIIRKRALDGGSGSSRHHLRFRVLRKSSIPLEMPFLHSTYKYGQSRLVGVGGLGSTWTWSRRAVISLLKRLCIYSHRICHGQPQDSAMLAMLGLTSLHELCVWLTRTAVHSSIAFVRIHIDRTLAGASASIHRPDQFPPRFRGSLLDSALSRLLAVGGRS